MYSEVVTGSCEKFLESKMVIAFCKESFGFTVTGGVFATVSRSILKEGSFADAV